MTSDDAESAVDYGIRAGAEPEPESGSWAERNLPLDPQQSCAFCGDRAWRWVYPLDMDPQPGPVALSHFWCACGTCHEALERDDDALLVQRHGPGDNEEPYPFAEVALPLFHTLRAGPPLARAAAEAGA